MQPLKLSILAKWLKISNQDLSETERNKLITGISTDSRTIKENDVFVAIVGEQFDGHQFIQQAEAKGAAAIIASKKIQTKLPLLMVKDSIEALGIIAREYRKQFSIPIAAVTGSCGKTTVKEMISSILSAHGKSLASRGNLNTEIGLPMTLMELDSSIETAVIEMGARKPGDIRYLMGIAAPTVTMITNAGVAHMGIFGSEKGIVEAKGEIYACLDPKGTAVLNVDEPNVNYWKSLIKTQEMLTFGFSEDASVTAFCSKETEAFSVFTLKTPKGSIEIRLTAPGRHNISNAMGASATALAMGISLDSIKRGLEAFLPVTGRLQIKMGQQGVRIIDDTYNANPVSVKAALAVLAAYPGQKTVVLGDMFELGDDAPRFHREIGQEIKRLGISSFYGVGALTEHAVQAFGEKGKHFENKASLIQELKPALNRNQTILIKGSRGMKMEEVVQALMETRQENHPC